MIREHGRPVALLIGSVAAFAYALVLSGCASAYDTAVLSKGAAASALLETAHAWVDYDAKHQMEIVDKSKTSAEAHAALIEYRTTVQAHVQTALHDAQKAMVALDAVLATWKATGKGDLIAAVGPLWNAVKTVASLLKQFGVPIPGGV